MKCDTCGSTEATMKRTTNGIDQCDMCSKGLHVTVNAHHGNRRIPEHFNNQLGEWVTEKNHRQLEKKHKVKIVNQPFQEYRKSNKTGEYMRKTKKVKDKTNHKDNFAKELRK